LSYKANPSGQIIAETFACRKIKCIAYQIR
jgi:hypothetical protein